MVHPSTLLVAIALSTLGPTFAGQANAQSEDPTVALNELQALNELKEGFALRKEGRFAEALPHLANSFRLAPNVKALLNLADCEEHLGHFVDAEGHWTRVRDLADSQSNQAVKQEASERLEALERRTPRLTIELAPGAPASSRVTRDGVTVPAGWLGVGVPSDPGRHVIEVSAEGYEPRVIERFLSERDHQRIEVGPGPQRSEAPPAPTTLAAPEARAEVAAPHPAVPASSRPLGAGASGSRGPLGYVAVGVGILGLAGIGFGAAEWTMAVQEHTEALNNCQGYCARSQAALQFQANADTGTKVATVAYIAGAGLAAGGVALFVFEMTRKPAVNRSAASAPGARRASVIPLLAAGVRGVALETAW